MIYKNFICNIAQQQSSLAWPKFGLGLFQSTSIKEIRDEDDHGDN